MTTANSNRPTGLFIVDDPIKPDVVLSPELREIMNAKFDETLKRRLVEGGPTIVITPLPLHRTDTATP